MTEKLLHAYFTDSKDLGDHETLADLAESAGLDRSGVLSTLQDQNSYANDVRIDEAIAQQYGISGVPYFIINQKYAISGAQPPETFANALQKVWEEEASAPKFQDLSAEGAKDASSTDGNCVIPNNKE